MKEIADCLMVTAPSATSLINNLMKDAMVERKEEEEDRRIVRITITKKGNEYLKKEMAAVTNKIRKNLEALTSKEQEQLAKILEKIVNHLKNKEL